MLKSIFCFGKDMMESMKAELDRQKEGKNRRKKEMPMMKTTVQRPQDETEKAYLGDTTTEIPFESQELRTAIEKERRDLERREKMIMREKYDLEKSKAEFEKEKAGMENMIDHKTTRGEQTND